MTITDDIKVLDGKIEENQAQHNLDREAAKSGVVEKAKFEYSPLGKVFNKGLDEKEKKEGL